jgi:nitric oxide dioxygenase
MQLEFKYAKDGITSKVLFKGEKNQATLFSMAAGTDIDEHTSTREGYVYVIEGDGVFNLEGEAIRDTETVGPVAYINDVNM